MVVQVADGRFLRGVTRQQNNECLSEFGIEPSVGLVLSDQHVFVGVALEDDANT